MTARWGAPAPDGIRLIVRAPQHPARAVECPHCGAHEHAPCTTVSKRRRKTEPCPSRITAWARATSVCPTCQVEPGIDCHQGGWPLAGGDVHQERTVLAGEAA